MEGKTVFTYSIGNFPTLRCLEQIRNDCTYHNADVKIVCVGGGLVYGSLGMSHQATEDIAVMRALPGMVIMAPGDLVEAEEATRAIAAHKGTCYLRLGPGRRETDSREYPGFPDRKGDTDQRQQKRIPKEHHCLFNRSNP